MKKKKEFPVTLIYVTPPTEEQMQGIRDFVFSKYITEERKKEDFVFETQEDASLGGGFILQVGNEVYNWSTKGRLRQYQEKLGVLKRGILPDQDVISLIRTTTEEFKLAARFRRTGVVVFVGDGIAHVVGLERAEYGEILIFDSGVKGMVMDIRSKYAGVILFGSDRDVRVGSGASRTSWSAGMPVGEQLLGRVVNALGEPLDGAGGLDYVGYRPIEQPAPAIVDRKSVGVPMETGILAIDSMFPIGRGQRELIIGDRQTGKTSIAMEAILNQKGKDVICIYVAIGQKASTVAQLVGNLKKTGAMEYTTVVSATAADPAPMQYIAPYAGTALAEYFMDLGRDVLIVYDDLSKHAVAYRALSLLLERAPGREAYPGDVFYLHSRLLERSARLSDDLGGGSITALPIIETQAGDVSAYIPTNVISITDGQIYLESELFNMGTRPAVNVGLSVSRVGGAAQAKAMKKAAGSIRIDLAQYREMEVFTQFSSDLDPATKRLLAHGRVLMELLKQPLGRPLSMPEQVITLTVANGGLLDDYSTDKVKTVQMALLDYMGSEHPEIAQNLTTSRDLSDEERTQILDVAAEFLKNFTPEATPEDSRGWSEMAKPRRVMGSGADLQDTEKLEKYRKR